MTAPDSEAPNVPGGLTRVAEEFRALEERRRITGLSGREVDRYHALFEQLSSALAGTERRRRMNLRQFLRVPCPMELVIRGANEERRASCRDFGGGGCAIIYDAALSEGDHLLVDGVIVDGHRMALSCRAVVAWVNEGTFGLRFVLDNPAVRDDIDRIFYQVVGRYLGDATPPPTASSRKTPAPATVPQPRS